VTAPAAPAPERAALWEDFLEIFIKPADVFERRKAAGFAVPLLILTVLFAVLWFGLKGAFQPLMDAENARAIAKVMAKNPQLTEEMMAGNRAMGEKLAPLMVLVGVPLAVLFVGLFTWAAGKMIGAVTTLGAAMMIATYSYCPRLLELLVSGAQVLLLPEEQITGRASVSLGAARAFDPDTASTALMAVLIRVDVFTLWITFLIAVGLRVVGKVPMSKALVGAGVVWVLGGLFTFLTSGLAG
jgi:hypothetical protein